jgi:hypothetical protein
MPGEGGEAFVVAFLEGRRVSGEDAQEAAGFADEPFATSTTWPDAGEHAHELLSPNRPGERSQPSRRIRQSILVVAPWGTASASKWVLLWGERPG